MSIIEHTARSLSEYTKIIEDLSSEFSRQLWYRGHARESFRLEPSIFRSPLGIEGILDKEERMLNTFKQRSIPYLSFKIEDEIEIMFLMQHYGAPTRLLEWSENPYIGLYFALENIKNQLDEDSVVYVMNPQEWNYLSTAGIGRQERKVFSVYDSRVQRFKIESTREGTQQIVAMYGASNNARIVAQRGAFTIFGSDKIDMETHFTNKGGSSEIVKIRIPKEVAPDLRKAIHAIGISESVVYPDLVGLCREIRRENGYG